MRLGTILAPCLLLALAAPLSAQSKDGHVYSALSFKAHNGDEAEYSRTYHEVLRPLLNHLMAEGQIVSYLDLVKVAGAAHSTHMVLIEYPSWAAVGEAQSMLAEASQAVFGRPWSEVIAERFIPFREPRGNEIYTAPPND